jgi:hypothetical protein
MESYIKYFNNRENIAHTKNFLILSLSMTDKALNMDVKMSELFIDVDIKLLLILTTLANTDESYIKGPKSIKALIKP